MATTISAFVVSVALPGVALPASAETQTTERTAEGPGVLPPLEPGDGGQGKGTGVDPSSCPELASGLDTSGIVTSESWLECSADDANGVTTLRPSTFLSATDKVSVLTTGSTSVIPPPNDSGSAGRSNGTSLRGGLDVSILRLNLSVPSGANCLSFDTVFASEEFPEFVGTSFNDGFIAELDKSTWSVDGTPPPPPPPPGPGPGPGPTTANAASTINAPDNFAKDANGQVISVNNSLATGASSNTGLQYDGATRALTARTAVTSGAHSLFLSIFDIGDDDYDSAAFIDNLRAFTAPSGAACTSIAAPRIKAPPPDFDGNGTTDIAVFRPSDGGWYVLGGTSVAWGTTGDIPVPGDYDGDGTSEVAVFRPSEGAWYVRGGEGAFWGTSGDIPMPGDYDGNGTTDMAVFRPSEGAWYVRGGTGAFWGTSGDIPVPGDYDGNGTTDIAVFRPSDGAWYVRGGEGAFWGTSGDIPVPGDYDGNGTTDMAVFRPSEGAWYVRGGVGAFWGAGDDIPVPGDYDGNGTTDIAVFRPSQGGWYVRGGEGAFWGTSGDWPLSAPIGALATIPPSP